MGACSRRTGKGQDHLHLLLKSIAENSVELLDVMLGERVHARPPEALRQALRVHNVLPEL